MNMPILTQFQSNQSMQSKDLLEIINSVRIEMGEPVIRLNKFNEKIEDELDGEYYTKSVVKNPNGTESVVYELTLDQCMLISMRESKSVRKNVLMILKQKEAQRPTELSRMDLIQLALQAEQENQSLRGQVAILEPKATALDRIADCTNLLGIREAAKELQIGQNKLTQYLLDHKVVYRDQSSKIQAYQKSIDSKLVRVVISAPKMFETGEKVFTQVKLTQKLITRIAKWLEIGVVA